MTFKTTYMGNWENARYPDSGGADPTRDTHIVMDWRAVKAFEYSHPRTRAAGDGPRQRGIAPRERHPSRIAPPPNGVPATVRVAPRRYGVAHFRGCRPPQCPMISVAKYDISDAVSSAPGLASFRTHFPDDPSLAYTYTYNHNRTRTAMESASHGAPWIAGRIGHGASPIRQDSAAEGIACAAEDPAEWLLNDSSLLCWTRHCRSLGDANGRIWPSGWGCWIGGRRHGQTCT